MNNEGQIVRAKTRKWAVIPSELLRDETLSWGAKGLLCFLLSMKDDWVTNLTHLQGYCKVSGNGRSAVRAMFKELQEAGYIMSQRIKNGNLYSGWRHVVYDSSQNPERNESIAGTVFVGTEHRRYEDQRLSNTNLISNTNQEVIPQAVGQDSLFESVSVEPAEIWPTFELFWDTYDKKVDREKVEAKWKKLKQEEREAIMIYLDDYIPATESDKTFRRNPLTFINRKTWLNEIPIKKNDAERITKIASEERLRSYSD